MLAPVAEDEYPSETEAASFEETKAWRNYDAEQAEGKEVPEEDEEVEGRCDYVLKDLEGPTENE